MKIFNDYYRGKKVFLTGHTGFKGSWMATWLNHLGADVIGYSLDPPSSPSIFEACHIEDKMTHITGDIRDSQHLQKVLQQYQPDIVFHLAAQALVRPSYQNPAETFEINVMGTVNVLEQARLCPSVKAVVSITSDKSYKNVNSVWGYRETDTLGGYDPYSASKACADLVISCLMDKRFQGSVDQGRQLPIASVRAGNVIGGGDWAVNRIVPDIMRAIEEEQDVLIRSPNATRPWQHVLEPLSGYLWLGSQLEDNPEKFASGWNFGPRDEDIWTVEELVGGILERWPDCKSVMDIQEDKSGAESLLLRLDCSKSHHYLDWRAIWTVPEVLDSIIDWYHQFYHSEADMYQVTKSQIEQYTQEAIKQNLAWAKQN